MHDDTRVLPVADLGCDAEVRGHLGARDQAEQRAERVRRNDAAIEIGIRRIVEQLILESDRLVAEQASCVAIAHEVHDAAVGTLRELEVELQLERGELIVGDDVTAGTAAQQHELAVLHLPTFCRE